ncbi:MAG TPA: hypothetical protein VFT50_17480 [Baekduia sp.]|nr:hypothetical protein [Baekduia sp.]
MTVEVVALVITVVVHFIGAGVLVWALLDGDFDWRELWPRDDDGRGGGGPDAPSADDPGDGGGVLAPTPLPDAAPSPVRLREPGRIGERYPRPTRRPEHAPERPRVPERS